MFCRISDHGCDKSNASSHDSIVFDKSKGKFKVSVKLSPKEYGSFGHEHIADMDSLVFDRETRQFIVPFLLSPQEYGNYLEDQKLPSRCLDF